MKVDYSLKTVEALADAHESLANDALLGATTAAMNLYVNPTTGSDSNPGTLALPFRTLLAALAAVPRTQIHDVIINLSGVGGTDPWLAPATTAAYVVNRIDLNGEGGTRNRIQLRGPAMVLGVPLTGPPTAALDAVTPARLVNDLGAPDVSGLRTELLFTTAAPGWTVHDLGPRGSGPASGGKYLFARITRVVAGNTCLVVPEIPVSDNTANSIIVDVKIDTLIQPTDTVELVTPGASLSSDLNFTLGITISFLPIFGAGPYLDYIHDATHGYAFERLTIASALLRAGGVVFDRCKFIDPTGGSYSAFLNDRGSGAFINCTADHITWEGNGLSLTGTQSRPDSASSPVNPTKYVSLAARQLGVGRSGRPGSYLVTGPTGIYGAHYAACVDGPASSFWQTSSVYFGGDGHDTAGILCQRGGKAYVKGGIYTRAHSDVGDLVVTGHAAVPYGTGVGQFEEAIGFNGNLHASEIVAGVPKGDFSQVLLYV